MNMRCSRRDTFHHLCSFHMCSPFSDGGLLCQNIFCLSPLSDLSVCLCFSIWGNGTLEQPSVTKRLKSRSSRQWTTCGSSWRRPTIILCWQLDICACETYTEIHKMRRSWCKRMSEWFICLTGTFKGPVWCEMSFTNVFWEQCVSLACQWTPQEWE